MTLGLAAIATIAIVIPALAQPKQIAPRIEKISKRALAKSRLALRTARDAKRRARAAEAAAVGALAEAASARGAAPGSSDPGRAVSGFAAASVSTSSETLTQLPGGPSVSVTVPPSGLIEVWAQVTIVNEGAVSLFEDGEEMPGQSETCGSGDEEGVLISSGAGGETFTLATPGVFGPVFCGTEGPPGPVLFQSAPGPHTYELRYEFCGCPGGGEATFSDRRLFVAPRP
jgi:hypothetical protein